MLKTETGIRSFRVLVLQSSTSFSLLPTTHFQLAHSITHGSGQVIKAELGEGTKVVFIGPCLAKKSEILSKPLSGDVDCVMTFEELHKLLDLKNISVAEMQPDYADLLDLSDSSTLSVSGGLSYALGLQGGLLNQDFVTCEGPENCIAVLDDIATGKIYPRFVDSILRWVHRRLG